MDSGRRSGSPRACRGEITTSGPCLISEAVPGLGGAQALTRSRSDLPG